MLQEQHGNATKLGGKAAGDYIIKGDFAVLTGTITMPEAGSGSLTENVEVDYPTGFTKDNCVIVSVMSHSSVHTDYWSTQLGNSTSASVMFGNFGFATLKPSKIRYASNKLSDDQSSQTITYKIVLMKIS